MRTRTTRPSSASAVPLPIRSLIDAHDLARGREVAAVEVELDRVALGRSASATLRSTVAPSGMRPALSVLICTFEPAAEAPAPPITRLPCAIA